MPQDCERGVQGGAVQSRSQSHPGAGVWRTAEVVAHATVMRNACKTHALPKEFVLLAGQCQNFVARHSDR
eukprot:COSAG02_NODE_7799_length_2841_cov_1.997812_3_plen_70_part_00